MGVDICHKHDRKSGRRGPVSEDVYLRLLVKAYRFLARRTKSKFNKVVLKRLYTTKINQPPISIARIVRNYKRINKDKADKTVVVVGTVTNDVRIRELPKMTICALHFTTGAKNRILKAGGRIMTFDELAIEHPIGKNTMLIQGRRTAREACKHFGRAPGVPHSNAKPYVRSKGRKFERARGRRSSRGFKV
ncbi:60S ribosomal protein L18 [Cichlidogyrus casuarinus]|uniref:60S ribosomal protein L18 n=1 Tax=Cichlidogyrus casuarinus TaxID=1844966 RepID=A0ABD2Q1S2_9PLAT